MLPPSLRRPALQEPTKTLNRLWNQLLNKLAQFGESLVEETGSAGAVRWLLVAFFANILAELGRSLLTTLLVPIGLRLDTLVCTLTYL